MMMYMLPNSHLNPQPHHPHLAKTTVSTLGTLLVLPLLLLVASALLEDMLVLPNMLQLQGNGLVETGLQ